MTLKLYNNSEDYNKINKTLSSPTEFSGMVVGEVNVINPVVDIAGTVSGFNYAEIDDFGRKYFVEEMRIIRTGITRVSLRCDPLTSFASDINGLQCIAKRVGSEEGGELEYGLYSKYIPDPQQRMQAYRQTLCYSMGDIDSGNSPTYILATVSTT